MDSGKRAAQNFDAFDRTEVDIGRLALPVRHAGGDVIDNQAYPPYAESGAGAEAADRYLQILGIVLPVLNEHSRYAR